MSFISRTGGNERDRVNILFRFLFRGIFPGDFTESTSRLPDQTQFLRTRSGLSTSFMSLLGGYGRS